MKVNDILIAIFLAITFTVSAVTIQSNQDDNQTERAIDKKNVRPPNNAG